MNRSISPDTNAILNSAARACRSSNAPAAIRAAELLRMRGLRYHEILELIAARMGTTPAELLPKWDALMDEADSD